MLLVPVECVLLQEVRQYKREHPEAEMALPQAIDTTQMLGRLSRQERVIGYKQQSQGRLEYHLFVQ